MISVTITDRSGRTLSGQTIDAFCVSIAAREAVRRRHQLRARRRATCGRTWPSCARIAECYVSCYPNAGLPNAFGGYDELPDETGALLRDFAASGFVNIVGGCCGTTPDHIAAIARRSRASPPRPLPADVGSSRVAAESRPAATSVARITSRSSRASSR